MPKYSDLFKCSLALLVLITTAHAEPFRNLDFESTTIPDSTLSLSSIDTSTAFPSWIVQVEGVTQQRVNLNYGYLDQDGISPYSSRSTDAIGRQIAPNVIQGSCSAYLSSGLYGDGVSLTQTGDIDAGTHSLTFQARNPFYPNETYFPGAFDVQINGASLPIVTVSSNGGDRTFGVDVSSFSGQTVTLQIGLHAVDQDITPHRLEGAGVLDNLVFSSAVVPEPASLAVLSVAGLGLVSRVRRRV